MAGKNPDIDWEKGEKLYRLGQLSAAEIGKQIGCSTSTVIRHMEKLGIKRDHATEVLKRTQEAIAIATQRNAEKMQCNVAKVVAEVTNDDIEEAVNANVALVMSHRKDIEKLVEVEQKLLEELNGEPTKLYIAQYQGNTVEKIIGLTVTEKASALLSLSSVQAKRIEKQRQAFGIDDNKSLTAEITLNSIPPHLKEIIEQCPRD